MSEGNPAKVPVLFTVITSSSLFTWVHRENFLRLFKNGSERDYKRFSLLLCHFSTFLSFPHIPCHNRLSEPVSPNYLKTDLVHTGFNSLQWKFRPNWMRNLSFMITLHSSTSGSNSVSEKGLLQFITNLAGASFPSCSMLANLSQFKDFAHPYLRPLRIHLTKWLKSHHSLAMV